MKNIWKWILGIFIILIVAVGLFGLGFVFVQHRQMMTNVAQSGVPHPQMERGSMRGGFPGGRMLPRNGPMMGMRGMDRGGRFFPGSMLFGMFGRLIPLALLGLLLYGAYRLGKKQNAPVVVPVTPAAPPAVTLAASHPCPSCGSTVQDDWKHCPNCGEKQA